MDLKEHPWADHSPSLFSTALTMLFPSLFISLGVCRDLHRGIREQFFRSQVTPFTFSSRQGMDVRTSWFCSSAFSRSTWSLSSSFHFELGLLWLQMAGTLLAWAATSDFYMSSGHWTLIDKLAWKVLWPLRHPSDHFSSIFIHTYFKHH